MRKKETCVSSTLTSRTHIQKNIDKTKTGIRAIPYLQSQIFIDAIRNAICNLVHNNAYVRVEFDSTFDVIRCTIGDRQSDFIIDDKSLTVSSCIPQIISDDHNDNGVWVSSYRDSDGKCYEVGTKPINQSRMSFGMVAQEIADIAVRHSHRPC